MKIILASSSPYRKELLSRILPDFESASPDIDESSLPDEEPSSLAARLAKEKAMAISGATPALVIGSDQVAWLDGEQLHKPGNRQNNIRQLQLCSGKCVTFYTAVALFNASSQTIQCQVVPYKTQFRQLTDEQIHNYVEREKAYDCAGGFKMEGLGIALFEHIRGDDPNSLTGLPMIALVSMLKNEGVDVLI